MLTATSNSLAFPVLTVTIFLPLVGAAVIALADERCRSLYHALGVAFAGLTLGLSGYFLWTYPRGWTGSASATAFQFADPAVAPAGWLSGLITYQVGLDGISVVLFFLTALVAFCVLVGGWGSVRTRVREYVVLLLVLETGLLGVFASLHLVVFYLFWELVLIPMYVLLAVWGGSRRISATVGFVPFAAAGSALMLAAMVALRQLSGAKSLHLFDCLEAPVLDERAQLVLFTAFALAFLLKVPLFPLRKWLPKVPVQAPAAGSVLLGAVLLMTGTYAFVRFGMPLLPHAAAAAAVVVTVLALVGIWYAALVAFYQTDLTGLLAYSWASHMGLVLIGIFALNVLGIAGGVLHMVNHGLTTGALFLLVGMLYDRARTRRIASFGGLFASMPRFAVLFMIVMLASIALPGTNGFVGEWLALVGAFEASAVVAGLAATGLVLGATCMLWAYGRVFFGPPSDQSSEMMDLTGRELAALLPVVLLIFWIGLYPDTFLGPIQESCQAWAVLADPLGVVAGGP